MGFVTNDHLVGAITVPPSRLRQGDMVADMDRSRSFTIEGLPEPITIFYHGRKEPVWLIKGRTFGATVRIVCTPRQHWYLLRRDQ